MSIKANRVECSVDWLVNVVDLGYLDGCSLFRAYDMELAEYCWIKVDLMDNIFVSYSLDPKDSVGLWTYIAEVAA